MEKTDIRTEVAELGRIMKEHFTYRERKLISKLIRTRCTNIYAGYQQFPGARFSSSVVFERERGMMREKAIGDLASKIAQNPETAKLFKAEQSQKLIRFCYNGVESELKKLHCETFEQWAIEWDK